MKSDDIKLTRDELRTVQKIIYVMLVKTPVQLLDARMSKKAVSLYRKLENGLLTKSRRALL